MLGISHLPITKSPFLRTRSWDLFRQAGDSETKIKQRIKDTAFAGVQGFSLFAELNCGVRDTSKREVLQKGVHHALYSLNFEEVRPLMAGSWELLGRSECPVWIPDGKMEKLPESAGHRIIHACKSLRWTLGLSEIDTCMGCSKRQRCPFYKKTLDKVDKPFVGLLLFGFFQYARLHLSRPRELPLGLGLQVWEAYAQVLQGLEKFLKDKEGPTGIPLAEGETRTQALEAEAQRKVQARRERAEQVTLNMPTWLRKTLRPLKSPGLTARQRKLVDGPRVEDNVETSDGLESDWVEETEAARFSHLMEALPQAPKSAVAPGKLQDLKVVRRDADGLDPLEDLSPMPRFETRNFRLTPQERQNLQDVGRYSAAKQTKLVVLQGTPSAEGGHLKRQNPQDPVGPLASSGFSLFTQPAPQVIQKNLLNLEDHPVKLPRTLPFDANKPVSSTRPKTFKSAPRLLEPRLDVRPLSESNLDQPHLLNESIGFTPGSQTSARKGDSPFQSPPDSQFEETPLRKTPSVGKPRVVFPKFPLADFEVREDFQTPITGRPVLGQLDYLFRKKPTRDYIKFSFKLNENSNLSG